MLFEIYDISMKNFETKQKIQTWKLTEVKKKKKNKLFLKRFSFHFFKYKINTCENFVHWFVLGFIGRTAPRLLRTGVESIGIYTRIYTDGTLLHLGT